MYEMWCYYFNMHLITRRVFLHIFFGPFGFPFPQLPLAHLKNCFIFIFPICRSSYIQTYSCYSAGSGFSLSFFFPDVPWWKGFVFALMWSDSQSFLLWFVGSGVVCFILFKKSLFKPAVIICTPWGYLLCYTGVTVNKLSRQHLLQSVPSPAH